MIEIVPAIIAQDIDEVKKKLTLIEGVAAWAQIDVMDGKFTPPTTFNEPALLKGVATTVKLEAHLMIAQPEESIEAWLESPVSRILLHYESTTPEKLQELIGKISSAGKEASIALKLETPISVLDPMLQDANLKVRAVQLMGIAEIGYHGHPFDERVLEKIRALHAQYPDVIIVVDGGVNEKTIPLLYGAGATRYIAGSAIYASQDPRKTITTLEEIIK